MHVFMTIAVDLILVVVVLVLVVVAAVAYIKYSSCVDNACFYDYRC